MSTLDRTESRLLDDESKSERLFLMFKTVWYAHNASTLSCSHQKRWHEGGCLAAAAVLVLSGGERMIWQKAETKWHLMSKLLPAQTCQLNRCRDNILFIRVAMDRHHFWVGVKKLMTPNGVPQQDQDDQDVWLETFCRKKRKRWCVLVILRPGGIPYLRQSTESSNTKGLDWRKSTMKFLLSIWSYFYII